jgi:hypothetical protein
MMQVAALRYAMITRVCPFACLLVGATNGIE